MTAPQIAPEVEEFDSSADQAPGTPPRKSEFPTEPIVPRDRESLASPPRGSQASSSDEEFDDFDEDDFDDDFDDDFEEEFDDEYEVDDDGFSEEFSDADADEDAPFVDDDDDDDDDEGFDDDD